MKREDSGHDLQYELKNRLSMHSGQLDTTPTIGHHQRTQLNSTDSLPGQPAMPDVDAGKGSIYFRKQSFMPWELFCSLICLVKN